MVWIKFLLSSVIIIVAAIKLAKYGDFISIRTGLGRMFIGLILMAGATSLPEVLTSINAIQFGVPDLAAGNIFGSNMFNMLMIGVLDLLHHRKRILRKIANRHALSGSLTTLLIGLGILFVFSDIDIQIGWVGLDSLVLISVYIISLWILKNDSAAPVEPVDESELDNIPSLTKSILGFSIATIALIFIMPVLVDSSSEIAEITGLGAGFVGTTLVSFVTSLPEVVTTIAAVRLGAYDMAVGNLFGSNMFNIFSLGIADFFMLDGQFLQVISPEFVLVGLIGLIMTILALVGNVAKLERKFWLIEIDAFLLILIYLIGLWMIYSQGISV